MVLIESLLVLLLNLPADLSEPARTVVVDIPERRLTLYVNGAAVKTFPIAVGKPSTPTPVGHFRVVSVVANPAYYNPAVGQWGPGEAGNPVGTRWIGLSVKGYGIHGTVAPQSIGRAASRGCIRLRNRDVEELSAQIKVGDRVEIRYELRADDQERTRKDIYKRYTPPPPDPAE